MEKLLKNLIAVALILSICTFVPSFGKGFDVNGEKDNGKSKYNP